VRRRLGRPWLLDRSQRWRLRYWRLWRGPRFDPEDPHQIYAYAFRRLSRAERAVFALSRFTSMDYPDIACVLSLSTESVEWRLVGALSKMTRLLDLIDQARGREVDALTALRQPTGEA
jgi:DNA-directed RNA polymerase specialized sigma24 family protein